MNDSITAPRWSLAQKKASQLSEPYSSPSIPVKEIAESNGVDVVFADFGEFSDDVSGFCDFSEAKLFVNAKDSIERKTFTMAHELGHWLLHKDLFEKKPDEYQVLPRFSSPDSNNALEKEANCFAANLLVPKKLVEPVKNLPVSLLAEIFGVSRTMMEFRIKNIK